MVAERLGGAVRQLGHELKLRAIDVPEPGAVKQQYGVRAQLDLVRSMRAAKVKSYAARTLGDISPKALQAISKFLDEEMMRTPEH